jgi:hypothetical protein
LPHKKILKKFRNRFAILVQFRYINLRRGKPPQGSRGGLKMETVKTKEEMPKGVHYKNYVVLNPEGGFPTTYIQIETMWYERETTQITADGTLYPVAKGGAVRWEHGMTFTNSVIGENWVAVG